MAIDLPFRDVILPIALAVAGIALGFWLDYLNHKHPRWFGQDEDRKSGQAAENPEPAAIEQQRPPPARETERPAPPPAECGCSDDWACSGMLKLEEDAYGTLYRCRACGRHYAIDNYMRKRSALSDEEAHRLAGLMKCRPDP